MKSKETGAISIEAVISMTFFMIAILAIMFISVIIKVQAQMQYAIGQTSKEISGYYYLLDKIGLATVTSGESPDETKKNLENIDDTIKNVDGTIKHIVQFSGGVENSIDNFSSGISEKSVNDIIAKGKSDKETFKKDLEAISKSLIELKNGDPKQQLMVVLQVFGKSMINKSFSYFVAPFVCKALVPKYLTGGNIEDYAKSSGLDWDSIDFEHSQLLLDGRSIKIDVVYTINTKSLTFGMVNQNLTFHQVASTAAWINPNGESTKDITDLENIPDEVKKMFEE